MKFLSFILAIMVLVLSCVPCSDAEGFATAEGQASINTSSVPLSEPSGTSNQEHNDLCSPFCQCSCCAVACTIPSPQGIDILLKPTFSGRVFAAYIQQQPTGISLPIWQPPQLV